MGRVRDYLGAARRELGPAGAAARDGCWRGARDADGVLWLALDMPGSEVNTITAEVMRGLDAHLADAAKDPPAAVIVRSAKAGGFAVGADLDALSGLAEDGAEAMLREGHAVLHRLEALECPTIAVVHGAALGAGFELALACDRRIAIEGATFGFPEVRLGLHPGLGGTVRLTELIDPVEAMTLMLTGKPAGTDKARELGITDEVTEERHLRAATRAQLADGAPRASRAGLKSRAFDVRQVRSLAARRMRAKTAETVREEHVPAPYRLIDLWEEHGGDLTAMAGAEVDSFLRLLRGDSARSLIRCFFLRRRLRNTGSGGSGIERVHVVGAGEMGAGIAAHAAAEGKRVTLTDVSTDALGAAVRRAVSVCRDRDMSDAATRDALDRLMPDPSAYGAAGADLVIEAVPESPALKRRVHRDLRNGMRGDAILATNTSSLPVTELAEAVAEPNRFAGLHFFNPVEKMKLVEVVAHEGTDASVADRLAAFCTEIDRLPVRVADAPGFLVNRVLLPYLLEALTLLGEGTDKETIDRAALDFGMPMGPVALADQVGLDICLAVAESLEGALDRPIPEIPERLREMVEAGRTGRKAGRGFYDWTDGPPEPGAGAATDPELADRLILPICDACVEALRREIAGSEDEIDAAMVFGTGFAPFRGGPLAHARARGPGELRERLERLAEAHGERFRPDAGWDRLG